jgi:hypothetical protein
MYVPLWMYAAAAAARGVHQMKQGLPQRSMTLTPKW